MPSLAGPANVTIAGAVLKGTLDAEKRIMISQNTAASRTVQAHYFPRLATSIKERRAGAGVMVCVSPDASRFAALVRKGLETARELDAPLYLVHVETLSESIHGGAKEALRELLESAATAHDHTEVVWLQARETVEAPGSLPPRHGPSVKIP